MGQPRTQRKDALQGSPSTSAQGLPQAGFAFRLSGIDVGVAIWYVTRSRPALSQAIKVKVTACRHAE